MRPSKMPLATHMLKFYEASRAGKGCVIPAVLKDCCTVSFMLVWDNSKWVGERSAGREWHVRSMKVLQGF